MNERVSNETARFMAENAVVVELTPESNPAAMVNSLIKQRAELALDLLDSRARMKELEEQVEDLSVRIQQAEVALRGEEGGR
jgi:hypothetical protein